MEIKNGKLKNRRCTAAFFAAAVFVFMFIFFNSVHPIVLLDADDWTYISFSRAMLPSTRFFNPARIFPEVFMSFCGSIAAYVIYPLTGEYMASVTAVMAAAVSFFIAVYACELVLFLGKRFRISGFTACCLTLIFLVFHFLFFRTAQSGNTYLFWSKDATCYFYYNIPILMNCVLVLRFMCGSVQDLFKKEESSSAGKALLILWIWLSVFSNLYASIVLAGYLASVLFLRGFRSLQRKDKGGSFLRSNRTELLILFLWAVSAVFELCGDRAEASEIGGSAISTIGIMLPEALSAFAGTLKSANKLLLLFLAASCGIGIIVCFAGRTGLPGLLLECAVSFLALSVLLVLLSAASEARYAGISTNLLAVLFFLFLAAISALAAFLERFSGFSPVLPFVFCLLVSLTNTSYVTFLDSNDILIDGRKCMEIGENLIDQFRDAESDGKKEFELHVLDTKGGETSDNWPHTYYMGERISMTMHKHGIVSELIRAEICPDEAFNTTCGVRCWD